MHETNHLNGFALANITTKILKQQFYKMTDVATLKIFTESRKISMRFYVTFVERLYTEVNVFVLRDSFLTKARVNSTCHIAFSFIYPAIIFRVSFIDQRFTIISFVPAICRR